MAPMSEAARQCMTLGESCAQMLGLLDGAAARAQTLAAAFAGK